MAVPKCGHCGHTTFAQREIEVQNSKFKHAVVYCGSCGAVFAFNDYYNIGGLLQTLANKLGVSLS